MQQKIIRSYKINTDQKLGDTSIKLNPASNKIQKIKTNLQTNGKGPRHKKLGNHQQY